jgi:hypothetical protein
MTTFSYPKNKSKATSAIRESIRISESTPIVTKEEAKQLAEKLQKPKKPASSNTQGHSVKINEAHHLDAMTQERINKALDRVNEKYLHNGG